MSRVDVDAGKSLSVDQVSRELAWEGKGEGWIGGRFSLLFFFYLCLACSAHLSVEIVVEISKVSLWMKLAESLRGVVKGR